MSNDFLPASEAKFLAFANKFKYGLDAHGSLLGVPSALQTDFNTKLTSYNTALAHNAGKVDRKAAHGGDSQDQERLPRRQPAGRGKRAKKRHITGLFTLRRRGRLGLRKTAVGLRLPQLTPAHIFAVTIIFQRKYAASLRHIKKHDIIILEKYSGVNYGYYHRTR